MNLSSEKLTELQNKLSEAASIMATLKKEYQAECQKLFHQYLKEFFEITPVVECIRWVQYTPYWNDGEECLFSVRDIFFSNSKNPTKELSEWGDAKEEDYPNIWSMEGTFSAEYQQKFPEVLPYLDIITSTRNMIEAMDSDVMKDIFGDHAQITITRKGIQVEEFEHYDG